MYNPSDLLYDLRIVSFHDKQPGPVSYAMHRSAGMPIAMAREYVNGKFAHEIFIRGITFIFAQMIVHAVRSAGGEAEMLVCPWSKNL